MSKKTVALIGLDVKRINFSDPGYSNFQSLGPDGIRAMLDHNKRRLDELGFETFLIFLPGDDLDEARSIAVKVLRSRHWDCILIGNGVRSIPANFLLFESLINLVLEHAPYTRLCFNARPDDSAEAVRRWVTP